MSKSIVELSAEMTIAFLSQGKAHLSVEEACAAYVKFLETLKTEKAPKN